MEGASLSFNGDGNGNNGEAGVLPSRDAIVSFVCNGNGPLKKDAISIVAIYGGKFSKKELALVVAVIPQHTSS